MMRANAVVIVAVLLAGCSEFRVRHDRVNSGSVTLRIDGQLHHIGLGHPHNGTRIILLINGYDTRVINAATGEIIRTLTINPQHRYHRTGKPIGGPSRPYGPHKNKRSEPQKSSDRYLCLATSHQWRGQDLNL